MPTVCETYSRDKAVHHLDQSRVVICAAGTGLPFFTTDTGAALRAAEMACDALFKGTSVDGIYSADPKLDPKAKRYDRLTYTDILARDLRIMDPAAIALARDNAIPVVVFSIRTPGAVLEVLRGKGRATTVTRD
jgi:uridylate kinase